MMAKPDLKKREKVQKDNPAGQGLHVTTKANVEPAAETIPDKTVLQKPAPKLGMPLLQSWGPLKKRR